MALVGLERLDNETRSKIRSTQILTSLPQIISELVQNSLDAGANNVDIGIHHDEWACWVRDDGSGMNKDGLALIAQGMEGGRYSSSKVYVSLDYVNTFGFRGEALASAADLSCIEISSRTSRSKESWSVILKGGERLYYGPSLRWRRERAGTTVSIRDAFFNLPIRRLSHPSAARTVELVRRGLESLALVFPHVAFSLQDASKESREGPEKGRVLTIPKTSSTLLAFRRLFGRALVEHVDEVDVQSGLTKIQGFLSLVGAHSKNYQFLYVNRHILGQCHLHRLIDQKFASSTFSKHAFSETGENKSLLSATRRSPRKGERRPIYVLNLTIPPREIDNCLDPAKSSVHLQNQEAVASFLADVIQSFLVRNGFSIAQTRPPHTDSRHSHKRRRVDVDDKMELDDPETSFWYSTTRNQSQAKRQKAREIYICENPSPEDNDQELTWVDPTTGQTYVIDPRTGNSFIRDQRQGGLDKSGSRPRVGRRTIDDAGWLRICDPYEHTHEKGGGREKTEMPEWIKRALESNDSFAQTEPIIPHLPPTTSYTNTYAPGHVRQLPWAKQSKMVSSALHSLEGVEEAPACSFTKKNLAGLQVIKQVDQKFIVCIVDVDTSSESTSGEATGKADAMKSGACSLVLVDQHAADERVRVEQYLKALCLGFLQSEDVGVERRVQDPPVPVLLTKYERDRLTGSARMKRSFRSWGFDVVERNDGCGGDSGGEHEEGYGMVHFASVPEAVADKLLAGSGDDLREVVKGYLARLEAEDLDNSFEDQEHNLRKATVSAAVADEFTWLRALRFCPHELIELVNSRACRGAIMFNDQLTVEQCKRLIRQLSMTAFPFQCAHGRPSLVPLTTIRHRDTEVEAQLQSRPIDWSSLF